MNKLFEFEVLLWESLQGYDDVIGLALRELYMIYYVI